MGLFYTCKGRLWPSDSSTHIIDVSGVHQVNYFNSDVKIVVVRDNCDFLTKIPLGITDFFPNLAGFTLSRCGIRELNGDDLRTYPNIIWFGIESSKLETIPGNLFQHTPLLSGISFGGNQLKSVGFDLLSNLPRLHRVYFANTFCINRVALNEEDIPGLVEELRKKCPE